MLKKIITLFVLLMFTLSSASLVYATSHGSAKAKVKNANMRAVQAQQLDPMDAKAHRMAVNDMRADRVAKARDRHQALRDHAKTLRESCADSDHADCVASVDKMKEHLHASLARIEELTSHLSDRLTDTFGSDAAVTDAAHAELAELKATITNAKTVDELRDARKRLHDFWKDHKKQVERLKWKMWQGRVKGILHRAEAISNKLERMLEQTQKDIPQDTVSKIEKLIAEIDSKVVMVEEAAKEHKTAAVNEAIHELHALLKQIVRHFKDHGHGNKVRDTVTDAVKDTPITDAAPAQVMQVAQ